MPRSFLTNPEGKQFYLKTVLRSVFHLELVLFGCCMLIPLKHFDEVTAVITQLTVSDKSFLASAN